MKIYITALLSIIILDYIWLKLMIESFYKKNLAHVFREEFILMPALIFYLIYPFILIIFLKYINNDYNLQKYLLISALFGFICYATYDLTNMATIKDWPLNIVIVDIIWGIVLTSMTGLILYYIQ